MKSGMLPKTSENLFLVSGMVLNKSGMGQTGANERQVRHGRFDRKVDEDLVRSVQVRIPGRVNDRGNGFNEKGVYRRT